MKRIVVSLILAFVLVSPVCGQLLWKVTSDAHSKPIYLFGTMHVSAGEYLTKHPLVAQTIKSCDIIYLEADIKDPALQEMMMQYISLPNGMEISDSLSPTQWNKLDSLLIALSGNEHFGLRGMNQYKPMYIQVLLTYFAMAKADTFSNRSNEGSVDMKILEMALAENKEVRYLESAEEQIQIVFDQPLHRQFNMLRSGLDKPEDANISKGLISKLMRCYNAQQLDSLAALLNEQSGSSKEAHDFYDDLLRQRNEKWLTAIKKELEIGRSTEFFGVGAGHLAGDDGLIQLLRAEGFTVVPVPYE